MPLTARQLSSALLAPVDLDLADGEIAVLSGRSGMGKSLLLRLLADLDPGTGEVRLDGRSRAEMPAPDWRRAVTYLAAEPGWWDERLGPHMADPAAAAALMPELGLDPERLDAPVAQFSTGERQRAALIRAVIQRPRFLLLDEPTGALDPASVEQVEALLRRLAGEGMGLLLVTHDAAQADRLARKRYRLDEQGLHEAPAA